MKKMSKLVLAGAIAFGGVGATSLVLPNEQASASISDGLVEGSGTAYPNQYKHTFTVKAQFEMNYYMYPAEFVIQKADGTEVQNGESRFKEAVGVGPDTVSYTTVATTSDLSRLPAGDYKIIYHFYGATDEQSFTKAENGTITNN